MAILHLGSLPRGASKSELIVLLDQVGGLDRRRIGRIEIRGFEATIEVPEDWLARLAKALDGRPLRDRRLRAWTGMAAKRPAGGDDHFDRLARLLEIESREAARQTAERARRLPTHEAERGGNTLVDLVVREEESGLGGRYLVRLGKRRSPMLPWTRLAIGSPVTFSPQDARGDTVHRGVVSLRRDEFIEVALEAAPDDLGEHEVWRLDLSNDDVAVERQRRALSFAQAARGDRLAELRAVLLCEQAPEFIEQPLADAVLNPHLNATQIEAVTFSLSARDIALIHGPPGTGKTTTVVELIRRAAARGEKVLACAPSNTAVDNIFERLLAADVNAVRIGHPARVMPNLRAHTLDLLVDDHPDVRLARKLVKEAMALFRQAERYTRAKPAPGQRREARSEAKSLLADARRLEDRAAEHILDMADVVCATTTGIDSAVLGTRRFDLAVIDEACQSTEPGCWIPLLRAERVVLAGDHCQLPPTIVSREAMSEGFGISLFERLIAEIGPHIARRLTVQYRMHAAIMDFSSREFYDGDLIADVSVEQHRLADLPGVTPLPFTESPLEFIDTAGASFDEELEPDGESRLNRQEAMLVVKKVNELLEAGVAPRDIAVIAPYAAQVRHLREALSVPELEIDSVDGFQGREKEAIVISLVRSNAAGEIGFLSDVRRMNVALTRARRKLLVIGDSATLSSDEFYRRLIEHFENAGAYRTVWEEGVP